MDLSEKIKQILTDKNISPSLFADEIGIQRSSISHILAGRNKPSLDIVQKIIKRFPELGVHWILDDDVLPSIAQKTISEPEISLPDLRKKSVTARHTAQENVVKPQTETKTEKVIEKVLVFYSDGTFKEFKQA